MFYQVVWESKQTCFSGNTTGVSFLFYVYKKVFKEWDSIDSLKYLNRKINVTDYNM